MENLELVCIIVGNLYKIYLGLIWCFDNKIFLICGNIVIKLSVMIGKCIVNKKKIYILLFKNYSNVYVM